MLSLAMVLTLFPLQVFITGASDTEMVSLDLKKTSSTETSITIAWNTIENTAYYNVYLDLNLIASNIIGTAYTITGLQRANGYDVHIEAYSEGGGVLAVSDTVIVHTNMIITSDYTFPFDMVIGDLYIQCSNVNQIVNLNGKTLNVKGNVILYRGNLNINNGQLLVDGDFRQQNETISTNNTKTYSAASYGRLRMNNVNDYVRISGDFINQESFSVSGFLTNGILEIKGDFTQINGNVDNFFATENHKVILSGDELQTVSFQSITGKFATFEVQNYSSSGVLLNSALRADTIITNGCAVMFNDGSVFGWKLQANQVYDGDLNLSGETLDLNGYKLTVNGNLTQAGGTVFINGGELEVIGDYKIQTLSGGTSNGILDMTNAADLVKVYGGFAVRSNVSHSGLLTAGTLEISGDFYQYSSNATNFRATETHTVILNGTVRQNIIFDNPNVNDSLFNNFEITNISDEGVAFLTDVYVSGGLRNTDSKLTNSHRLYLTFNGSLEDNAWNYDLRINNNRTLSEDTEIGGTLYIQCSNANQTINLNGKTLTVKNNLVLYQGTLNINNGQLFVDGDFRQQRDNGTYAINSILKMVNPNDYVRINGDYINYEWYSQNGQLTNGILEIRGDFTQLTHSSPDNFFATENHKVILSGDKSQTVSFQSATGRFNVLEITKPIASYNFNRTPVWITLIERAIDNEPPTAPSNLRAVSSNTSSCLLEWEKSTDNYGVEGYAVYRNNIHVANTTSTRYVDSGLNYNTLYIYYVVAYDLARNYSGKSNIVESRTMVNHNAPSAPTNVSFSVSSNSWITVSWVGAVGSSVAGYNIYRDDVLIGQSNGTSFVDRAALPIGTFTYYVRAFNDEEMLSPESNKITADNEPPTTPVLVVERMLGSSVTLNWESNDNVGITSYDLYRNGVLFRTLITNTFTDTSLVEDMDYSYYVRSVDTAGNISEVSNSVVISTEIDETSPVVISISPNSGRYSKDLPLRVNARDNKSVASVIIQYSFDKVEWHNAATIPANGNANPTINYSLDLMGFDDGVISIRAVAINSRNIQSDPLKSPIIEYYVDNTAPTVPANLKAEMSEHGLRLNWSLSPDDDIAYFKVYRKTDANTNYVLIRDRHSGVYYYDDNIEIDDTYNYRVSAVDQASNESDLSEVVTITIESDDIKPKILNVSPTNGTLINTNQVIYVSALDNFKLSTIVVDCKADGEDWKNVYTEHDINTFAKTISFTLNTDTFNTGTYQIRVHAVDTTGNISEYLINEYEFKKSTLSAPVLTAVGGGWKTELSWAMTSSGDVTGYNIYKKTAVNGSYTLLAMAKSNERSYIDYTVKPDNAFYYMIEVFDGRGNRVKSNEASAIPTDEDDISPIANAGFDVLGIMGETINFNGSLSWDNHYIDSYEWNFGDGTTLTGSNVSHVYTTDGIYNATLTVKDSAGNSHSHTIKANVYNNSYSTVELRAFDDAEQALSNVMIHCEIPGLDSKDFMTNEKGEFKFVAENGIYDMYFYKEGYLPVYEKVTITGANASMRVNLKKAQLVSSKISVERLDINEIINLGIEIDAPENQYMYRYVLEIVDTGYTYTFNSYQSGEIIGTYGVKENFAVMRCMCDICECDICGECDSRAVVWLHSYSDPTIPPTAVILSFSKQITWLKEFFNVNLTVINNAPEEFAIMDSVASIRLPDGLSLADVAVPNSAERKIDRIMGGSAADETWIIRGETKGKYDLQIDFNGVLMPLGVDVNNIFKSIEPINVLGGDAMELEITTKTVYKKEIRTYFKLTNVSDFPVYNLREHLFAFSPYELDDLVITYPDGRVEVIPWTRGRPDFENMDEFYPALRDVEIEIKLMSLEPGEFIEGYFAAKNKN